MKVAIVLMRSTDFWKCEIENDVNCRAGTALIAQVLARMVEEEAGQTVDEGLGAMSRQLAEAAVEVR